MVYSRSLLVTGKTGLRGAVDPTIHPHIADTVPILLEDGRLKAAARPLEARVEGESIVQTVSLMLRLKGGRVELPAPVTGAGKTEG